MCFGFFVFLFALAWIASTIAVLLYRKDPTVWITWAMLTAIGVLVGVAFVLIVQSSGIYS